MSNELIGYRKGRFERREWGFQVEKYKEVPSQVREKRRKEGETGLKARRSKRFYEIVVRNTTKDKVTSGNKFLQVPRRTTIDCICLY